MNQGYLQEVINQNNSYPTFWFKKFQANFYHFYFFAK